ncbi:MAG: sigma-70 family RNA polymerase sigma factor [Deltaproteobacteria bacterium]|nr:sigma-70 family RNA polymerase sigma factor [Deltaproteobacteria bacterium]MBP6829695.1 sigma-70 family RNA polymerase sigma factor [Deltaproteobacteria bacterium]
MRRVVQGDTDAFRRIVDATSEGLVRLGARIVGSLSEAEDVVQDSYVKAYQALTSGRFERRSSVTTWLRHIVTNTAIDSLRSRSRRPVPSDTIAESGWDGEAGAEAHMALAELNELLGALPPDQRAAVVLQSVEGHAVSEIAVILGCSEGAVEQRLVRARATLRERSAS